MILSVGKEDNISFHMNIVSQLAALVCQSGVHRNKDRSKHLIGRNLVISLYDILLDDIFLINGSKFVTIYFQRKVDNISFHLNLVSQLAALVCRPGVHSNKDRGKHLIGRNLVISLYYLLLDYIFLENGWKFFHNTFPALSWQYFLSFESSQPIGRARLYDWRSWKHR